MAKLRLDERLMLLSIVLASGFGPSALAGSAAQGTPTPAPQKGVNISSGPKAPAADDQIARLQWPADLLAAGRARKAPLPLIVAARIMKSLGGTDSKPKPEARTPPANTQKSGQPVSPETILVE